MLRALVGRHVVVAVGAGARADEDAWDGDAWVWRDHLVRHAGWMASAVLAFVALQSTHPHPPPSAVGDDDDAASHAVGRCSLTHRNPS